MVIAGSLARKTANIRAAFSCTPRSINDQPVLNLQIVVDRVILATNASSHKTPGGGSRFEGHRVAAEASVAPAPTAEGLDPDQPGPLKQPEILKLEFSDGYLVCLDLVS